MSCTGVAYSPVQFFGSTSVFFIVNIALSYRDSHQRRLAHISAFPVFCNTKASRSTERRRIGGTEIGAGELMIDSGSGLEHYRNS